MSAASDSALSGAVTAALQIAHRAERRYGPFTSTHEALGVMAEEWDELRTAVHSNSLDVMAKEAEDVAAAALRFAAACRAPSEAFARRSGR